MQTGACTLALRFLLTHSTVRGYGTESGSSSSGSDDDSKEAVADVLAEFQQRVADLSQQQRGDDPLARIRSARPAAASEAGAAPPGPSGAASGAGPSPRPPAPAAQAEAWRTEAGGQAAEASPSSSSSSRVGLHPKYGYAVLGGVDPEQADEEAGAQQPKLHPRRNFTPGDTYDPEDLNPFGLGEGGGFLMPSRRPGAQARYRMELSVSEARTGIDFRNAEVLRHFVSDSGRLRPRRETRMPRGLQRRAAKAVKLARQMALMPFEMVVGDAKADARSRMTEYETARRSHRRGGGGGSSGGGGGGGRAQGRGA